MPQTPLSAVKNVVRYIVAYYSHTDMDSLSDEWFIGKAGRDENNVHHNGAELDGFAIDHAVIPELNNYIHSKHVAYRQATGQQTNEVLLYPGDLNEKTTIVAASKNVRSRLP